MALYEFQSADGEIFGSDELLCMNTTHIRPSNYITLTRWYSSGDKYQDTIWADTSDQTVEFSTNHTHPAILSAYRGKVIEFGAEFIKIEFETIEHAASWAHEFADKCEIVFAESSSKLSEHAVIIYNV